MGAEGNDKPTIIDEVDLEAPAEDLDALAFAMYQKAVRLGTWQPSAVDLGRDKPDVEALDERHRAYLERFAAAFYNAEENVAKLFGPWVMAAPTVWMQAFFSTQLLEEFKHVEFFHRYFGEVFGHRNFRSALANPVHDTLRDRSRRILQALDEGEAARTLALIEGTTHYMCVIEGVQAMTGYGIFHDVFARKGLVPGFAEGYKLIRQDEGRHVGFGLRFLRHYARREPRYAARIREIMEEYLPLIRVRYGQKMEVNGRLYEPPDEERGVERLMTLYNRRLQDIFDRT
jgi:ribonucleoside-diphosphate reductase beta chain